MPFVYKGGRASLPPKNEQIYKNRSTSSNSGTFVSEPFSVLKVSRYACSIPACVNTIHSQRNDEHQDRNDRGFASGGSGTLLDLRGGERGSTERGDGRGGRRGREETPQGSGFSTPVHQHRTPNNNENSVVVNQSVIPRTLEDLARDSRRILAAEKNDGFVTKRSASCSGGKRVRPTKDKRMKPALTNKIRKKKRSVVVVAKSTSYRSYTAFQLYSAIMYFTGMSDMLLENEWDFEDDWNKGNDNDDDW